MGMKIYKYVGVFFEIDYTVDIIDHKKSCPNGKTHVNKNTSANFCPQCGKELVEDAVKIGERYLTVFEIEDESGIEEGFLLGPGEIDKSQRKYFGLNYQLSGIRKRDLDEVETIILDDNPSVAICDASKNVEFMKQLDKLRTRFGDSVKVHYGVFTYIM